VSICGRDADEAPGYRRMPSPTGYAVSIFFMIRSARTTVLFRRGEPAFGMFLILKGTASLDFGVDGAAGLASAYGPGALVGLPATLTGAS
jgi:hypothetical protein